MIDSAKEKPPKRQPVCERAGVSQGWQSLQSDFQLDFVALSNEVARSHAEWAAAASIARALQAAVEGSRRGSAPPGERERLIRLHIARSIGPRRLSADRCAGAHLASARQERAWVWRSLTSLRQLAR